MKKHNELVEYHLDCGYWSTRNDQRYGYVLCPEPFRIPQRFFPQLTDIGILVADYHRGIKELFKFCLDHADYNRTYASIARICKQATDGLPILIPERNIPITKVDLMIDTDNRLRIAEIDSYNPRGIPFALFLRDIYRDVPSPFCGITETIRNFACEDSFSWIYADKERYYSTAFKQMQRILSEEGIAMSVHNITELQKFDPNSKTMIIPWGIGRPEELRGKEMLVQAYDENPEKFMFPLVPWTATKGLLGIVSNGYGNPEIEHLVENFYAGGNLNLFRTYTPPTVNISKQGKEKHWCYGKKFVLKKNVSSGLKGVWIADTTHEEFQKASNIKRSTYIAQEFVEQRTFPIPYYTEKGHVRTADWYLRLTAYIGANGEVLDTEITGRQTPDVHGAPDCIMLPCVR